jgi:hypothetical protein
MACEKLAQARNKRKFWISALQFQISLNNKKQEYCGL